MPFFARMILGALIGAIGCFVGDHLHVTEGVLAYAHPCCWQQAWWVFPLMLGANFGMFGVVRLVVPPFASPPPSVRVAAADFLAFLTAYAFTAFGNSLPIVVFCVLLAFWLTRVIAGLPKGVVLLCLLSGLSGTVFEIAWSGLGMFHYLHPDFFSVAIWLPVLYMHAGIAGASSWRVITAPS